MARRGNLPRARIELRAGPAKSWSRSISTRILRSRSTRSNPFCRARRARNAAPKARLNFTWRIRASKIRRSITAIAAGCSTSWRTAGKPSCRRRSIRPACPTPGSRRTRFAIFDVADLPELPDDIVARLAEALKPFGYAPAELPVGAIGSASLDGDSPHRALNDAALANLDAWVPALKLDGCVRAGGHYRAVASWRPVGVRPAAREARGESLDRARGDQGFSATPTKAIRRST
jgi:hypothetical protein